jgi:kinesin family protein 22
MAPLVDRFLQGENCVFFAYGMTNSGKTHTIQGTEKNPGLLPRLVNEILEMMQKGKDDDWVLEASMLEIYQEKIFDLLGKKKDKLLIRDANGKVEVCKLSSHSIASTADAIKLMNAAAVKR